MSNPECWAKITKTADGYLLETESRTAKFKFRDLYLAIGELIEHFGVRYVADFDMPLRKLCHIERNRVGGTRE